MNIPNNAILNLNSIIFELFTRKRKSNISENQNESEIIVMVNRSLGNVPARNGWTVLIVCCGQDGELCVLCLCFMSVFFSI